MEKAIASIGAQLDAANGRLARIAGEAEPGGR
jgi:hypothetical protein